MDGSLMGIDWKQLSTMVGPALQQELNKLPPEAQQALHETEAYVTLRGNRIDVDVRFREEDPHAEKIKGLLLNSLIDAIPYVIKMFGCRAFARKMKEEESGPDE